jgi:rubrerythrin
MSEQMEICYYCPRCGELLELDPDGGYCTNCDTYYDKFDLEIEGTEE